MIKIDILILIIIIVFYLIIPFSYFQLMNIYSNRKWNINNNSNNYPKISMIIPTYNEAKIIRYKLLNLSRLNYPKNLLQIIFIDSNSNDETVNKIQKFTDQNPNWDISIINENERKGKTNALNIALNHAKHNILIVSDADCFLSSNIIIKSLPYIQDKNIAAVCGEEYMLNEGESWVTKGEYSYREKLRTIRAGESKFHSTIRFEGGYAIYKKNVLGKFSTETGADDSEAALNIIQKKMRAIFVPELKFYTFFPSSIRGKLTIKIRRANQFAALWFQIFKLLLKGGLILPKTIAIPNIYLHLINPIIFMMLFLYSIVIMVNYPQLLLLSVLLIIPSLRILSIEYVQSNIIMFASIISRLLGIKITLWSKSEDSRNIASIAIIQEHNLI